VRLRIYLQTTSTKIIQIFIFSSIYHHPDLNRSSRFRKDGIPHSSDPVDSGKFVILLESDKCGMVSGSWCPSKVIQQFPIPHNWKKCKYTLFLTRSILGTGLFSWHNVGEELDDGRFLKKHVRKSRKKSIYKPRKQSSANETKCRASPKKRRIEYLDLFVSPKIKKRRTHQTVLSISIFNSCQTKNLLKSNLNF